MRISRIYQPSAFVTGELLPLDERASHYVGQVLRLRVDDALVLFDGEGQSIQARIDTVAKKQVTVLLGEPLIEATESSLDVHLYQAISRSERMDFVIQKAVELGVVAITPMTTTRCSVKLDEKRLQKRMQHWQQVIISACEQSGRARLPALNPLIPLQDVSYQAALNLVLQPGSETRLRDLPQATSVALFVGPEGGFDASELQLLNAHENITAIQLGPRVLRTETAALATIASLQALWD